MGEREYDRLSETGERDGHDPGVRTRTLAPRSEAALALAEATMPAAGASAEGSFLMMLSSEASAPDFAGTSFTRAFLAPHA